MAKNRTAILERDKHAPAAIKVPKADREIADASPTPSIASHSGQEIALSPAAKPPEPPPLLVHIEVIHGGITNVKVPVAIGPRYQGLPFAGPAKAFDHLLDSWLTRCLDLGMIGSGLGQLFPVNLQRRHEAGTCNVEYLLVIGMGEPGQFGQDDLRYMMSNVTVAVKCLRQYQLSTHLIGTRRNELPFNHAVRGFLEGVLDGFERFRAIVDGLKNQKEAFQDAAAQGLFVAIVEPDEQRASRAFDAFMAASEDGLFPGLHLEVARGDAVPLDPVAEATAMDVEPEVALTLMRVTRQATDSPAPSPADPFALGDGGTELLQYSAICETAAVSVREVEVNSYLVRELPARMTGAESPEDQEAFGVFFQNYLIPDEFRRLTEGATNLTFVVDETTAAFPWEMVAYRKYSRTNFLGTTVSLSRRFHSLLSPPPSSLPPLNNVFKVLIIADPAPGKLSLPHARDEGCAVLEVLDQARKVWQGVYTIRVTLRIGSHQEAELLSPMREQIRKAYSWVESVEPCDPLKTALLVVNEHYDVIHYAGHGAFDRKAKRAGWLFDRDCFLSAQEIFRVRQVPRLVFANACFSAVTANRNEQRGQMVGLAQAFFARGIPNYIGTGWQVDDACACECARAFYTQVLGLRTPKSPPATIGDALLEARRTARKVNNVSTTWGAYQHYGSVSDKLLPLPNAEDESAPGESEVTIV